MQIHWIVRLAIYAAAVTIVSAIGAVLINALSLPSLNPGTTVLDGLPGYIGVLAFTAPITIPVAFVFFALVALVTGITRRYTWWTGALSGLIPASLFAVCSAFLTTPIGYVEPVPESTTTTLALGLLLSIGWSTMSAALLAECLKPGRSA